MIKLTRLNGLTVLVNPDHIYAADAAPDTTLRLANGETILVKESLDELIARVVSYRKRVRDELGRDGGHDASAVAGLTERHRADVAAKEEGY